MKFLIILATFATIMANAQVPSYNEEKVTNLQKQFQASQTPSLTENEAWTGNCYTADNKTLHSNGTALLLISSLKGKNGKYQVNTRHLYTTDAQKWESSECLSSFPSDLSNLDLFENHPAFIAKNKWTTLSFLPGELLNSTYTFSKLGKTIDGWIEVDSSGYKNFDKHIFNYCEYTKRLPIVDCNH